MAPLFAVVCVLAAARVSPLPSLGWAAAFLFLAIQRDMRDNRIPNWLTFPAFGLALAHAGVAGGLEGALSSLLGAATALALLVVPYARGWFGAGDVKAMMALGALWGAGVALSLTAWAVGLGGLLALAWVGVHEGLPSLVSRWWRILLLSAGSRRWSYIPPDPGTAAAGGIPFALAIGLAVAAHQIWGSPWA